MQQRAPVPDMRVSTLADAALLDDPVVLEHLLAAAPALAGQFPASPPRQEPPSYAWPVFLGLVGSAVAGRRARRAGHPAWPYWLVGAGSTAFMGWALLTVMPAALGRGDRARSIYGAIPAHSEDVGQQAYAPEGVPGVTDIDDVVPESHRATPSVPPPSAVELGPSPGHGSD